MRLVRDHEEVDVQLEGWLVRIDRTGAPPELYRTHDVAEARAAHAAAIEARLAAGWTEVIDPALDHDFRLVYGDELQLRGDPIGELISTMHELEQLPSTADPRQRRKVENRVAAILDDNHDAWFGTLARHVRKPSRKGPAIPSVDVAWRLGFAEEVHLRGTPQLSIEDTYARLRELPLSRQIVRLVVGETTTFDGPTMPTYEPLLEAMLAHGIPSRLRELVINADHPYRADLLVGDLRPVIAAAPALEVLRIAGQYRQLAFESPTLRVLEISGVTAGYPDHLARATLPALEELVLHARQPIGPPLLAQFPRLAHVTLDRFTRAGVGAVSLLDHAMTAPAARTIALLRCELDDRELAAVIEAPARFAHLTRLDLRHNRFSRSLAARAKRLLPSLKT